MIRKLGVGFVLLLSVLLVGMPDASVAVKVYSLDEGLNETNMSKPRIYIQNTGTETITGLSYRYYFSTENGTAPVLEDYYTPDAEVIMVPFGDGYYVQYTVTGVSCSPGGLLPHSSGNSIGLHYNEWSAWDKSNDFSNNQSSVFSENQNIAVFYNGALIYGNEPGGIAGSVVREVWTNVPGIYVTDIPLGTTPQVIGTQSSLDAPKYYADNIGARIRGYITAPVSGDYTFWIASDDYSQLFLSTDDDPANKGTPIASVSGWTQYLEWTKYSSQQSTPRTLAAGQRYYVEILHKEGDQGDHCTVGWQVPGSGSTPVIVPGTVLSPYEPQVSPEVPSGFTAQAVSANRIDLSWTDGAYEQGYILTMSSGGGGFVPLITLTADLTSYQVTGLTPETGYRFKIKAYNTFGESDFSNAALATTFAVIEGKITREVWMGISGTQVTDIPVGTPAGIVDEIYSLETPQQWNNYYGQRIRGYIIPPATGSYTFWIASDDCSQLWLSTDNDPANKNLIASVAGYTDYRSWNKYASQKSAVISLTAGVSYYIEILHKDGSQNDNLSVGWIKPGQSGSVPSEIIPGSVLSPYVIPTQPDAPSGLAASAVSATQIDLTWSDNSDNENGFYIERALGAGTYAVVATVAPNATIYHDAGLSENTQYQYRIRAFNDLGTSAYSNTVSAVTLDQTEPLPPAVNLYSFAVYSSEKTTLKDQSVFSGGGAVGSNVLVEMFPQTIVTGNVISGDDILLHPQAVVNGDATAADEITLETSAVVNGTVSPMTPVAVITIPEKTSIPTGTEAVTVASGETRSLSPGYYAALVVQTGGILRLSAGVYTFTSFFLQPEAQVQLDVAFDEMVDVEIAGDLEFSDRSSVSFLADGYIPFSRFYTNDANTVRIGCDVQLTGSVTAPHAAIAMFTGAQCNGALYAREITVEPLAVVQSDMSNPENDSDGDRIPDIIEVVTGTDPTDPLEYRQMAIPSPAMIDNSQDVTVTYDYSMYPDLQFAGPMTAQFPANSLERPYVPLIIRVSNDPADNVPFALDDHESLGRYINMNTFNDINPSASVTVQLPVARPLSGESPVLAKRLTSGTNTYAVAPSTNAWDDRIEGTFDKQSMLLMAAQPRDAGNPENMVVYFDNGYTYANQQHAQLDIEAIVREDGDPMPTAGSMVINYDDYSSGTAVARTINLAMISNGSSDMVINPSTPTGYVRPGRIEITAISIEIPGESITYTVPLSGNVAVEQGRGLRIVLDLTVEELRNNRWIGDRFALVHAPNRLDFESATIGGEGRIKVAYATSSINKIPAYDYYLKDHLGSTRMVIDETGTVSETVMYQPYGSMSDPVGGSSAGVDAREKFTTKEFDTEGANGGTGIGMFYFGARYYDADVGVWNGVDPKGEFWNSYSYVGGNVINYVDPNGMEINSSSQMSKDLLILLTNIDPNKAEKVVISTKVYSAADLLYEIASTGNDFIQIQNDIQTFLDIMDNVSNVVVKNEVHTYIDQNGNEQQFVCSYLNLGVSKAVAPIKGLKLGTRLKQLIGVYKVRLNRGGILQPYNAVNGRWLSYGASKSGGPLGRFMMGIGYGIAEQETGVEAPINGPRAFQYGVTVGKVMMGIKGAF